MTTSLLILRGIPGSGKSTFAKTWVNESPSTRVRINRDDIRFMLFGKCAGVDENAVTTVQDATLRAALKAGKDVVLDNTNLARSYVIKILKIAQEYDTEIKFKDFPIRLSVAIDRDARRERQAGEAVIRSFWDRYTPKGSLPPTPVLDSIAVPKFAPIIRDDSLPQAYIVDTDGTVAQHHRNPYDTSLYHTDAPIEDVVSLVRDLSFLGYKIIGVSGRSEEFREVTEKWWYNNGIPVDEFYMRPIDQPKTNDAIVKSDLHDKYVAGRYNVVGVIDDRLRVARMWHQRGLTVFRVGDPDADF